MKSNCNHDENKNLELEKEINEYLNQLDLKEKIAYKIAMEHLGTSFNIVRSNGFSEWKKNKK
jgi:hypothetical protein